MSRDLISRLLGSPLALTFAAVLLLFVGSAITMVLIELRRRRREKLSQPKADLSRVLESEDPFVTSVSHLPLVRRSEELALRISNLFREQLRQRLVAIYACQQDDLRAKNLLPSFVLDGMSYESAIPRLIDSSAATQFERPRAGKLSLISAGSHSEPHASRFTNEGLVSGDTGTYETGPPASGEESFIFLPWSGPFNWSGVLVAEPGATTPEELVYYSKALAGIGEKLGLTLELEQADARLADSSERSVNFSQTVLASLEEESPVAFLIKEIAILLGAESAAVWKADAAAKMVSMSASHGLRSSEFLPLPVGQGLAGSIVQTGEVLALEDAPSDPRCIFPREARESGIASYLGAPVTIDGDTVAVVEVHCSHRRQWSDLDRRMLEAAASVIGQLMKSADARGKRLRVESAYLGLSEALQRLKTQDELLDAVVEVLGHALGVSRAVVVDLDDAGHPVPVRHEFCAGSARSAREANLGSLVVSEVLESEDGKAVAIQDSTQRSLMAPTSVEELQMKSEIAVPVRLDGSVKSIIYLHQCDRMRDWQPDEIEFIERVARQLSLSLMNVHSFGAAANEAQAAKEAARHAAEAQSRMQSLINALPESVLVLDAEGRLNYFNARARESFRFTNEDIGSAAGIGERLTSNNGSVWEQVLTSSQPARFGAELTRAVSGSGGSQAMAAAPQTSTPVSISVTPFRATHGGPVVGRIVVVSDVSHLSGDSIGASQKIVDLQQKITELGTTVEHLRTAVRSAETAEATARKDAETAQVTQAEATAERDKAQAEVARYHAAAQQLLETNRLKSDFIVSAGHEIEASLQPVLGMLELLGQGQYGPLIPEQQEAIRNIYGWARRIKGDVDWLIEYGSARSRRLESAEQK